MRVLASLRLPPRRALAAGLCALAAAVAVGGAVAARERGRRAERFTARGIRLAVRGAPPWLPPAQRARLERPPVLPAAFSIFDREVLGTLRRWYEAEPWVARVGWIGPLVPGRGRPGIALRLRLRTPAAAVRAGDRYLWVDAEGRCLGPAGGPPRRWGFPAVAAGFGPGARGLPAPGEAFRSRKVREGLALAALLREGLSRARARRRIEVIDATRVGRDDVSEICLVLDDGRVLEWGRGPASRFVEVLPQAVKLRNLRAVIERGLGRPGRAFALYRPLELELARQRR